MSDHQARLYLPVVRNVTARAWETGAHNRYMGRQPDRSLHGQEFCGRPYNWQQPVEDIEADGCPAGWVRSPWVTALVPFRRRRVENGDRVDNPFFTNADWLIQSAVLFLEEEEERLLRYRDELLEAHYEKERKESEKGNRR